MFMFFFFFSCVAYEKKLNNTQLTSEYLPVTGAIDILPSQRPPIPIAGSPHLFGPFQDPTFFTKVPLPLLSSHQRLSKKALILKADLA